jgi:hypothetical protein
MAAVPIKPEYQPTLGRLLAPRWRAASPLLRAAAIVSLLGLAVLIPAAVLTLQNASFSHGGKVPFSFSYRSLYRAPPDPGGWVKVQRHGPRGQLQDSFAVEPLTLPPYAGGLSGEQRRAERTLQHCGGAQNFDAVARARRGEHQPAYNGSSPRGRREEGVRSRRPPWPQQPGREGAEIVMLTSPKASPQATSPWKAARVCCCAAEDLYVWLGGSARSPTTVEPATVACSSGGQGPGRLAVIASHGSSRSRWR